MPSKPAKSKAAPARSAGRTSSSLASLRTLVPVLLETAGGRLCLGFLLFFFLLGFNLLVTGNKLSAFLLLTGVETGLALVCNWIVHAWKHARGA